jgi:hypothetical protein
MPRYNVQVKLDALNWSDPTTPLFCHCLTEAASPEKARELVASGPYRGMPNRVVPPLGMPCNADLSIIE